MRIRQFACKGAEKWKRPTRLEVHTQHGLVLHCVDDKYARISSRQNRAGKARELLRLLAIMNANLVITEVDYQLNCPTRDNPFFSMRLPAVKQPKMVDEFANRRPRSIRQIEHRPSNSSLETGFKNASTYAQFVPDARLTDS